MIAAPTRTCPLTFLPAPAGTILAAGWVAFRSFDEAADFAGWFIAGFPGIETDVVEKPDITVMP